MSTQSDETTPQNNQFSTERLTTLRTLLKTLPLSQRAVHVNELDKELQDLGYTGEKFTKSSKIYDRIVRKLNRFSDEKWSRVKVRNAYINEELEEDDMNRIREIYIPPEVKQFRDLANIHRRIIGRHGSKSAAAPEPNKAPNATDSD